MRALRAHLADTYFRFDPRSLGLFRIVFGVVLLTDLRFRYQAIDTFYTNDGLFPNHTLLWARPVRHLLSVFFTASTHGEAAFLMALCAIAFTSFLLGFRTKLSHVASAIALLSMNTRLAPFENGGDMVMNILCLFTLFLPLGQRFSVDAVRASLHGRAESSAEDLLDRSAMHPVIVQLPRLAVAALILQFFAIYLFNVVHKTGPTWTEGTAVHYVLHQDRLIKQVGVWMRDLPMPVLRGLAYGTLVIELLGAITILSPIFTKYTRLFALIAMPLLHLGFELALDLGVFSFSMMAFFVLLLAPEHWEFLRKLALRWHKPRVVFFDASCGVCFAIVRLLARLDVLERLRFVANTDTARLPSGVTPEMVDSTIVVVDEADGSIATRSRAVGWALRSLPLGFIPALVLSVPVLRQLADVAYDYVARNRANISVGLGLAACGVPQPQAALVVEATTSPWHARLQRVAYFGGNLTCAVLMLAIFGDIMNSNAAVPQWMRYRQPEALHKVIEIPRLYQGWRMFAPHAPEEDFSIEVDAVTSDGRHVDPYNEVASRVQGPNFTEIPALLHQDQFFTAYSLFIWRDNFRAYRVAFQEWILRYPDRTGRKEDKIVSFVVYKLQDRSPLPGQKKPTKFTREAFMRWNASGRP
jgi:predicted DCC family thiol-disulfide oxidoreductase YuxK